jgi:hypothetical protein
MSARSAGSGRRAVVFHGQRLVVRDGRPTPWRPHPGVAAGLLLMALAFLLDLTPATVVAIGVGTILGVQTTVAVDRGRRMAEDLAQPLTAHQVGSAVADALRAAGLSPRGAEAVLADEDRVALRGVEASVADLFRAATAEAMVPWRTPAGPAVPRWVLDEPVDNSHGLQVALRRLRPHRCRWHAVPAALAATDQAEVFARAWDRWVGGTPMPLDRPPARSVQP